MSYKILIIDDDNAFLKLLQLKLKSFMPDNKHTVFNNLGDARKFLKENPSTYFDLVILDEHLPDGKGLDLLSEGWFEDLAVLSVSSDDAPEIPGALVQAGANYFLNKMHVSQPLFEPLVLGIIDRNKIQRKFNQAKIDEAILDTVKTLVGTLRHEINNPLGAVLGAAYILNANKAATSEQKEAASLVESSGKRIKHVLDQLCQAIELDPVRKADQKVFHIPGDDPWDGNNSKDT